MPEHPSPRLYTRWSTLPRASPYIRIRKLRRLQGFATYPIPLARGCPADGAAAQASTLPTLNDKQLEKLRQLSLITIASRGARHLTYPSLLAELELPSIRALEDLVISAIYASLLDAKLDTKAQRIDVVSTAGRDVAPKDIAEMVTILEAWSRQCEGVLSDLDAQITKVQAEAKQQRDERVEYERALKERREAEAQGGMYEEGKLGKGKRVISESGEDGRGAYDDDGMDLDELMAGAGDTAGANVRRAKGRIGNLMSGKKRR